MNPTVADVTSHLQQQQQQQQPHFIDTNHVTMTTAATTNTDPNLYALNNKKYYYNNQPSQQNSSYLLQNFMYNNYHSENYPTVNVYHIPAQTATTAAVGQITPPPPPLQSSQLVSTNRLAYVEALVDINAVVIESIWYPQATNTNIISTRQQRDSRISPVVPLRTFIQEVLKRSRTTYSTLQTALFYLFRARPTIVQHLQKQQQQQQQQQQKKKKHNDDWQFNAYISCGRRMFLASLVVASKFVQDKTYRNSAWAKIAGLSVREINTAERYFLTLLDYRLYIDLPTFDRWHRLLHLRTQARIHNIPISIRDLSTCLSFAPRSNEDISSTTNTSTTTTTTTTTTTIMTPPITPTTTMAYPSINTNSTTISSSTTIPKSEPTTPTLVHSYSSSVSPITNINITNDKPNTVFYYSSPLSLSTSTTATTATPTPPPAMTTSGTTTASGLCTNSYCLCTQCSVISNNIPNHPPSSFSSFTSSPAPQTPTSQISPVRYYPLKRKFDHSNASSSCNDMVKKHCRFWQ